MPAWLPSPSSLGVAQATRPALARGLEGARLDRRVVPALAACALAAWVVALRRMHGMDAGPGTDLGGAGWYVGTWVTMMAAMMLPSAAPMVMLYAKAASQQRRRPNVAASAFLAGYLVTWSAFGLVAYGLYRLVAGFDPSFLAWDRGGRYVAGAAIVVAGCYQLSSLKLACLRHCRSPLSFLVRRWRGGSLGGIVMGAEHGAWCVGCCWALMACLFALGLMSITWMALISAVVFAEKVLPVGELVARVLAVALIGLGILVAVAPGSVPALTDPAQHRTMDRRMQSQLHVAHERNQPV